MTTGTSGFAAFSAVSFAVISVSVTASPLSLYFPWLSTVMACVLFSAGCFGGALLACGRFAFMPWTEAVHMRMKMTRSTYARSSIGVMLMSSYGLSSWICMALGPGVGFYLAALVARPTWLMPRFPTTFMTSIMDW